MSDLLSAPFLGGAVWLATHRMSVTLPVDLATGLRRQSGIPIDQSYGRP